MPLLIQVCVVLSTLVLVGAAIALLMVLPQLRRTAAQVERTAARVESAIPTVLETVEESRAALESVRRVGTHLDHIGSNIETVGGKAAHVSNLVLSQVLAPVTRVAAVITGVKVGTRYLVNGLTRGRALTPSQGGNHHE